MSKITMYRNGTWYGGLCLDELIIETDKELSFEWENYNSVRQQGYELRQLGYEVIDNSNNPFKETTQHEYYNHYDDKVVVRIKDKTKLVILKQYNSIENCETTVEVITRLGALNKLFDDIVKIYTKEYRSNKDD